MSSLDVVLTAIQKGLVQTFRQDWETNHASKFKELFEKAVGAGEVTVTYTLTSDELKHQTMPVRTRIEYLKVVLQDVYEPWIFDIWCYITAKQNIAIQAMWKKHVMYSAH